MKRNYLFSQIAPLPVIPHLPNNEPVHLPLSSRHWPRLGANNLSEEVTQAECRARTSQERGPEIVLMIFLGDIDKFKSHFPTTFSKNTYMICIT